MARHYHGTGEKGKRARRSDRVEEKHPAETAQALEEMADPLASFESIAEACGLPRKTVQILAARLRRRWIPVDNRIKQIRHKELLSLIEDRMLKSLEYMDDVAFATADLRDIALTFGILHDKRQLLMGQPTQILSVQERSDLDQLVPMLLEEAQRRGITIDSAPLEEGKEGVSTHVTADLGPLPPRNRLPQAAENNTKDLQNVGDINTSGKNC